MAAFCIPWKSINFIYGYSINYVKPQAVSFSVSKKIPAGATCGRWPETTEKFDFYRFLEQYHSLGKSVIGSFGRPQVAATIISNQIKEKPVDRPKIL